MQCERRARVRVACVSVGHVLALPALSSLASASKETQIRVFAFLAGPLGIGVGGPR